MRATPHLRQRIVLGMAAAAMLLGLAQWRGDRPAAARVAGSPSPPAPAGDAPRKGPDRERFYFARWHEPYDAVLPAQVVADAWDEVDRMPAEPVQRGGFPWIAVGPFGMDNTSAPGTRYSGRLLDLGPTAGGGVRVAAASGGIWNTGPGVTPISDQLTSLAIGSLFERPDAQGTIFAGTGELFMRAGTGPGRRRTAAPRGPRCR
jgi:hypothetical protein